MIECYSRVLLEHRQIEVHTVLYCTTYPTIGSSKARISHDAEGWIAWNT